jgi:hypothetical protein
VTTVLNRRLGELRPSQLLYTFGIGAAVDLPHLSALVLGLDDWDVTYSEVIEENRLLGAVRAALKHPVSELRLPPHLEQSGNALDEWARVGVPAGVFPRWLRCPRCSRLGSISSGLFDLKTNPYRPDQAHYEHNCGGRGKPPAALPVRFLLACPAGHLDDFPWVTYVHRGSLCKSPLLQLYERGITGRAAEVLVKCEACDVPDRSMADAFGEAVDETLPRCRGRHPHLKTFDADCKQQVKTILLGASNAWFPVTLSVLSIPASKEPITQKVAELWRFLRDVSSPEVLAYARSSHPELVALAHVETDKLWDSIEEYRRSLEEGVAEPLDLHGPEWSILSHPETAPASDDFRLRSAKVPPDLAEGVGQVVLADRLREVVALVGFTRVAPPDEVEASVDTSMARISRRGPDWVPCAEVRGEGVFVRLPEDALAVWETSAEGHEFVQRLLEAHRRWRVRWNLDPDAGWPGARYILLHTLSHVLIRELALESGYGSASLRERLYASSGDDPMAGLLLYTAASDSEGTLGGLVSLGEPENLSRILKKALEHAALCSSDPLCSEHDPTMDDSLHGAACHACLFGAETSCERGNRYLDRALLVPTFSEARLAYFGT